MSRFNDVFLWHLRRERARLAVLSLAVCAFTGLLVAISKSIRPAEIQELVEKLPPAFQALIGLENGVKLDLGHWLAIINNHPVWLIGIFAFPISAGLRGLAGGLADGTLEPVLAQPISRSTYYLALTATLVVGSVVVLTASFVGGLVTSTLVELPGELSALTLLQLTISGLALVLAGSGITLLASAACSRRATSTALGVIVVMFFVRFLADMWPASSGVSWLSIFRYHNTQKIVRDGLGTMAIVVLLAFAVLCVVAGLFAFRRRQLTF